MPNPGTTPAFGCPPPPLDLSTVSPDRRALVNTMSHLGFGRIEDLEVREGEPVLGADTRVLRDLCFGKAGPADPPPAGPGFALKRPVIELFEAFDRIGSGRIEFLEIHHGLPFRMRVEEGRGVRPRESAGEVRRVAATRGV
jgi:hypothetical protein